MEKEKHYHANIVILSTDRGDLSGKPSFIYSTKGVGRDKVNKFELPSLSQWNEYEKDCFWNAMIQGLPLEIMYKKNKPNYQLIKVDAVNLTKPRKKQQAIQISSSSSDQDEVDETSLLINEISTKLSINPMKSIPVPLNHTQPNYRNLTFLYRDERVYIHAIPVNRSFYKVDVPEGTPFIDSNGCRWLLSTYVGETKMYQKHDGTGKEVKDPNFRAPQYVEKKGMNNTLLSLFIFSLLRF